MTAILSHRETSDNYHGELFRAGKVRVALCRDGIQWLIQRQTRAERSRGAGWRSFGYFTTREALTRLWREVSGADHPDLAALPDHVRGERG